MTDDATPHPLPRALTQLLAAVADADDACALDAVIVTQTLVQEHARTVVDALESWVERRDG